MMNVVMWVRLQWDRVGAWVCIGGGVIVLFAGWIGISSKVYPGEELPYILSGGIGGVFLLGLGGMLWLSADLRDEWRKLDRIEKAIYEKGIAVPSGNGAYFGHFPAAGSLPPIEPAAGSFPQNQPAGDVPTSDGDLGGSRSRSRPLSARPLSASRRNSTSRGQLDAEE
jgi:hypothetical protein